MWCLLGDQVLIPSRRVGNPSFSLRCGWHRPEWPRVQDLVPSCMTALTLGTRFPSSFFVGLSLGAEAKGEDASCHWERSLFKQSRFG